MLQQHGIITSFLLQTDGKLCRAGRLENIGDRNKGMIILIVQNKFVVQFFAVLGDHYTRSGTFAANRSCHHATIGLTKGQFSVLLIIAVHIKCCEIMLFQKSRYRNRRIFRLVNGEMLHQ